MKELQEWEGELEAQKLEDQQRADQVSAQVSVTPVCAAVHMTLCHGIICACDAIAACCVQQVQLDLQLLRLMMS